jgi:subtilase family serine protease
MVESGIRALQITSNPASGKPLMFQFQKALFPLAIPLLISSAFGQSRVRPTMTRHVRQVTRSGQARWRQRLPLDRVMQLDLVLPLSDPGGLHAFLKAVNDPSSPSYHNYVTPPEFTARFGPTQAQYDAVLNFAKENGLAVTGGTRDGMDVQVTAPVIAIENAFHISMATYQHPKESRTFYAPDREPTLALPFQLWHVSGLNNYSIPRAMHEKRADYAQAHGMSSAHVVSHAMTGSGLSASFLGSDMRAAYYGNGPLTGAGQTLGLLEYQGTNLSDVTLYYQNAGQTQPLTPVLISADGTSTACTRTCDDTEPTIDITQALGMAPGLKNLYVYVGSSDTAILSAMTTTTDTRPDLPMTIGCSWGWLPADPEAIDIYFQKMQAQGQTFFAASGDNSTWTAGGYVWPSDDPYVVTVGGTDLVTTNPGGDWLMESAWVNSGGGISTNNVAIPWWQQIAAVTDNNNGASARFRNGPDVAANADWSFYVCANGSCTANRVGGTSFAAPMWAAYVALANEQAAGKGLGPAGFINPTIYAQNAASSYATNFHDVTYGTSGSYSAVPGYDLVTGWGSPTPALIDSLTAEAASTPASFSLSLDSPSGVGTRSSSLMSQVTVQPSNGFRSNVVLSAWGGPSNTSISFNPPSVAPGNSSTVTVKLSNGDDVQTGTYTITVSATGADVTKTALFTLTVQ